MLSLVIVALLHHCVVEAAEPLDVGHLPTDHAVSNNLAKQRELDYAFRKSYRLRPEGELVFFHFGAGDGEGLAWALNEVDNPYEHRTFKALYAVEADREKFGPRMDARFQNEFQGANVSVDWGLSASWDGNNGCPIEGKGECISLLDYLQKRAAPEDYVMVVISRPRDYMDWLLHALTFSPVVGGFNFSSLVDELFVECENEHDALAHNDCMAGIDDIVVYGGVSVHEWRDHQTGSRCRNVSEDLNPKQLANLDNLRALSTVAGVPHFLVYGTLLGWMRECSILPHTTDVDVGVFIEDYTPDLLGNMQSAGFTLQHTFGTPQRGFEHSFTRKGHKLDIFYIYTEKASAAAAQESEGLIQPGDEVRYGTLWKGTLMRKMFAPVCPLTNTTLHGVEVQVPTCASKALGWAYGSDFMTNVVKDGPYNWWSSRLDTWETIDTSAEVEMLTKRLWFVIPFRDRAEHFEKFMDNIEDAIKVHPDWNVSVMVVEQDDDSPFRRGWLFNVGLSLLLKADPDATCYITHDVDLLTQGTVDYSWCDRPTQPCSELSCHRWSVPYSNSAGGTLQATPAHWKTINGYTNEAYGWGGEDDEIYWRMVNVNLTTGEWVRRPEKGSGRCVCLHDNDHTKRVRDPTGYRKVIRLIGDTKRGSNHFQNDGINNVNYTLAGDQIHHRGMVRWVRVVPPKVK